jgi:ribosomal protein S18 acetylase RimI-like enzyme
MPHILDNPIWQALSTRLTHLSVGGDLARRFDASIGPLAGLSNQSPEAYAELAGTLTPGQPAVLFLDEAPRLPANWKILREGELVQMICPDAPIPPPTPLGSHHPPLTPLIPANVPAMLELVKLTEPGPFGPRTIELGNYLGLFQNNRLAAMAGQRLAPPGFREVSAVCTHPDFRGRSYAHLLVTSVAQLIRAQGETPFLTSLASNTRAIRVYQAAGFHLRRTLHLLVITPPTPAD